MKLERLTAGMPIPWGGDKLAVVGPALAEAFRPGDALIVVQENGALLHIPAAAAALARSAVDAAQAAFHALAAVRDDQISKFFDRFAAALANDAVWARIAAANRADVERARGAGRSTTRLEASEPMRAQMIAGLRAWRDAPPTRGRRLDHIQHGGWTLDLEAAPLGVVGFVFEGRPNVFSDAAGVVRGGNTAVFRIGSDALGTAQAIAETAMRPALAAAGLPAGTLVLVESAERAAGWALFADPRLALAVARGSGPAVTQLGAVARQAGTPASLHGTGGAWIIADVAADPARLAAAVTDSLDRKVCNTLNVGCIVRARAAALVPVFVDAVAAAGKAVGHGARLHVDVASSDWLPAGLAHDGGTLAIEVHDAPDLGHEWEWDTVPETWLTVVDDLDTAIDLFNAFSPRFAASLISGDAAAQAKFYARIDAPFVGDGFTRWVDGQYALGKPELGLSNWQSGRLFARGGVLSGDGVYTIRARMRQADPALRR
jgi:glutamate-5-semialdehyde dehydrogenase